MQTDYTTFALDICNNNRFKFNCKIALTAKTFHSEKSPKTHRIRERKQIRVVRPASSFSGDLPGKRVRPIAPVVLQTYPGARARRSHQRKLHKFQLYLPKSLKDKNKCSSWQENERIFPSA